MDSIGKRIRWARKRKNFTLNDIKNRTGLSTGNLSDLENGKFMPSANALILLKDVLEVSIDWILTGEEKPHLFEEIDNICNNELRERGIEYCNLSDEEKELIDNFRLLDDRQKEYIKEFIMVFLKNEFPSKGDRL